MSKFRRTVLTIHGINSDGDWHADVREALEPHFRCVPLSYPQFRRLGWLKVFSGRFRRKAVRSVAEQFSERVSAGSRPHLIAHSFGTWIAAHLMKRPKVQMNRVIFVGCPLPPAFDWEKELAENTGAFNELTNECGLQDRVVGLARWARIFRSPLGEAGRVGFRGRPEFVHSTGALRVSCEKCQGLAEPEKAKIHNVSRRDFGHSDWFIGNGHAGDLWLPYFWGFSPDEYADFIELCLSAAEMENHDAWLGLVEKEKDFRARSWSWTRDVGAAVDMCEYVERSVAEYLDSGSYRLEHSATTNIRDRAIRLVWRIVGEAIEERGKLPDERDKTLIKRLHPQIAIQAAVDAAVKVYYASDHERPGS